MTTSSIYSFTSPVRYFKENDPYYYEVDNIPLRQLEDNTLHLKDRLDRFTESGGINRASFSELKPYVNGIDNKVRVKPGRYTARINDAYSKTRLQQVRLLQAVVDGANRQYTSVGQLALSSFNAIVDRVYSDVGSSSLSMNGLAEMIHTWRVLDPDIALDTTTISTSVGVLPTTGNSFPIDKSPLVWSAAFYRAWTQNIGHFSDISRLSAELCKQWRGVTRTAVVDVPDELEIDIPAFDPNDFKRDNSSGLATEVIPNAVVRVDLLFIYSHPIDDTSTSIINYTNGTPRSITTPILGIVKGAGAILQRPQGSNLEGSITKTLNANGELQILANVADQYNTDNGFQGLNIHGSFPSPDDLLNIAPNLVENLESNNFQLLGQSVLPIAYIVVRKSASVNSAGETIITDSDVIDIRPFFRTTELSFNERAGIAAATPSIHYGNPVVGQAQLEYGLNTLKQGILSQFNTTIDALPRVVAGGIVWGGKQFGAEGAIRLAAQHLNGVSVANLPYNEAPTLPDWDLAEWWQLYASFGGSSAGSRRNDRINVQRKRQNQPFDSGTDPTNSNDITTAMRNIGTQHAGGSISNPYCVYWVKKEILIDRSLVPWMEDYTVDCELVGCLPQTHKSSRSVNSPHEDESGSAGIWVERKFDRFFIYVGWLADSPDTYSQDGVVPHGKEPRLDRDTFGFSGFVVRSSDMGLPTANNMGYDGSTVAKAPNIGTCTYPTVTFKITGYPSSFFHKTLSQAPQIALIPLK